MGDRSAVGKVFEGKKYVLHPVAQGIDASQQRQPKLLDRMRQALRARHYSRRTEESYCGWVRRYIFFHNVTHPGDMGEAEINAFLTHLAVDRKVSSSTQNQALSALLFLYRHVLGREVGDLGEVIRARKPKRLPVVMTRAEVKGVLTNLSGDKRLVAVDEAVLRELVGAGKTGHMPQLQTLLRDAFA